MPDRIRKEIKLFKELGFEIKIKTNFKKKKKKGFYKCHMQPC